MIVTFIFVSTLLATRFDRGDTAIGDSASSSQQNYDINEVSYLWATYVEDIAPPSNAFTSPTEEPRDAQANARSNGTPTLEDLTLLLSGISVGTTSGTLQKWTGKRKATPSSDQNDPKLRRSMDRTRFNDTHNVHAVTQQLSKLSIDKKKTENQRTAGSGVRTGSGVSRQSG